MIDSADRSRDFAASFDFAAAGPEPLALRFFNPKPCCARMTLEPATLRPGETATLRIDLRVPRSTGAFSFPGSVSCDATQQTFSVALQGRLALGVELTVPTGPEGAWPVAPTEPRTIRCEVVRRIPAGQEFPPLAVETTLAAKLLPGADSAEPPYAVRRQILEVALTAPDDELPQRAAIALRETAGRKFSATGEVTLRLAPFLKPAPAAVVLKDAAAGEVALASTDGRSFRILAVATPDWLACDRPTAASKEHKLSLRRTNAAGGSKFGKVSFVTDHPKQKSAFVAVAAVGSGKGGGS